MKNMKIGTAIWVCLLLSFFFGTSAKAESITSPDGQLKLNFFVNTQGEPVYELSYKGKEVIKPSKLGLELKNDPGLMNGFTLADIKTSAFLPDAIALKLRQCSEYGQHKLTLRGRGVD